MDGIAAMDRAYDRRQQLLVDDDVAEVVMALDQHGVTLTISRKSGGHEVEFLPNEPGD